MSRKQKDICILEWNCDKMKPSSVVQSKRHDQLKILLSSFESDALFKLTHFNCVLKEI